MRERALLQYRISAQRSCVTAGSALDVRDKDGYTPLHLAVSKQQYSTVQLLLKLGANVNATTRSVPTPPPPPPPTPQTNTRTTQRKTPCR